MESYFEDDSPLAALLEGHGTADDSFNYLNQDPAHTPPFTPSVAPQKPSLKRFTQPLNLRLPAQGTISKLHHAWSRAVNSRIGRAENNRFLEHFRYLIVASQLLNEYPDLGSLHTTQINGAPFANTDLAPNASLNVSGVAATAGVAFVLVLLLNWLRGSRLSKSRILLALLCAAVAGVLFYAYIRRQWLQYLRHQAVDTVSSLTTNARGFDITTSAALSLIQEVELVSKGYRLSTPLPPISRFDDVKVNRKCAKLRAALNKAYTEALPTFRDATISLKVLLNQDDMEKYLDVYDIPHHAVQEAVSPVHVTLEEDDPESLRSLRVVSYQYSTLRRVVCCSLMSLEADGGNPDFARWSAATKIMDSLSTTTATWAQKLSDLLREVEEFTIPREARLSTRPAGERLRTQVRKITDLSQGIRSLQAKMALMREESTKAIEDSDDLTDLGPNLMSQYESIGADLKMLMQAWENGKASLASNLDKQERRISQASSGLRSPAPSLGGLTAVEEGGPADALRALNGESKSNRSSLAGSGSDEEVFEGVSLHIPRQRSSLTREERIAKMHEERARLSELRDKRESSTNMIRELQSVMNLRPKRNTMGARITSI
ncbi:hypothetical protein KCU78_g15103, partial [Aureobasidium melanogenum]